MFLEAFHLPSTNKIQIFYSFRVRTSSENFGAKAVNVKISVSFNFSSVGPCSIIFFRSENELQIIITKNNCFLFLRKNFYFKLPLTNSIFDFLPTEIDHK